MCFCCHLNVNVFNISPNNSISLVFGEQSWVSVFILLYGLSPGDHFFWHVKSAWQTFVKYVLCTKGTVQALRQKVR